MSDHFGLGIATGACRRRLSSDSVLDWGLGRGLGAIAIEYRSSGESAAQNMCSCETNPPFSKEIYCVSFSFSECYAVCRLVFSVGSFSKTNPPGGTYIPVHPSAMLSL